MPSMFVSARGRARDFFSPEHRSYNYPYSGRHHYSNRASQKHRSGGSRGIGAHGGAAIPVRTIMGPRGGLLGTGGWFQNNFLRRSLREMT